MEFSARSAWLLLEGPAAARAASDGKDMRTEQSMWLLLEGPAAAEAAGKRTRQTDGGGPGGPAGRFS